MRQTGSSLPWNRVKHGARVETISELGSQKAPICPPPLSGAGMIWGHRDRCVARDRLLGISAAARFVDFTESRGSVTSEQTRGRG